MNIGCLFHSNLLGVSSCKISLDCVRCALRAFLKPKFFWETPPCGRGHPSHTHPSTFGALLCTFAMLRCFVAALRAAAHPIAFFLGPPLVTMDDMLKSFMVVYLTKLSVKTDSRLVKTTQQKSNWTADNITTADMLFRLYAWCQFAATRFVNNQYLAHEFYALLLSFFIQRFQ